MDEAAKATRDAIAPHLQMKPDDICSYIIIAVDHSDGHTPVTLSTVTPEELPPYLAALALWIRSQNAKVTPVFDSLN